MKTHEYINASPNKLLPDLDRRHGKWPIVLHRGLIKSLITTATVTALCAGVGVAQSLTDGLVAHYPFNGNANDASGNGNDGLPANGAHLTTDRTGQGDSAFEFDGVDDFIQVTTSGTL